jgi:hypothetical protein
MAYGTINADQIGTSVANTSLGAGNASIMKNRIINGAMTISQRNGTSSVTPAAADYTLDRFYYQGSQASKFTVQQNAGSVTLPTGFSNYLGMTVASAVSIGSTDYFYLAQNIEGFNTSDLMFGTANAKTITLSFQVYSSLTGTFGGALNNSAGNRSYPFTYTISSANTWTTISITIAGDTTGTWVGATNGIGLKVIFGLGVGSTYSGTAGSWAGANYASATGATSVVGTNGATFYITGVQLEVGSIATGYEYRMYGTELANCQRYFQRFSGNTNGNSGDGAILVFANYSGTSANTSFIIPISMRSSPSFSYSSLSGFTYVANAATFSLNNFAFNGGNINRCEFTIGFTGATGGNAGWLRINSSSNYIDLSSEL